MTQLCISIGSFDPRPPGKQAAQHWQAQGSIVPTEKLGQPDERHHTCCYRATVIVLDYNFDVWQIAYDSDNAQKIAFQYLKDQLKDSVAKDDIREEYHFEMPQTRNDRPPYDPDAVRYRVPDCFEVDVERPIGFQPPL